MHPFPKKSTSPLLFFIILSLSIQAQQNITDSLLTTLPLSKDVNYVLELQKIIPQFPQRDTQMKYWETVLELSIQLDYIKGKAQALYHIGKLHNRKNNYIKAASTFEQVIPIAQQLKDTSLEFNTYRRLSDALLYNGKADEAFQYLLSGLKIAEESQKIEHQADIFYQLGDFHRLQHNFQLAVDNFEKALPLYQQAGLQGDYCWVRSCVAMTYKRFDEIEKKRKGIAIYEELLNDECSEVGSLWTRAKHYNNLGSAYVDIGDLKKGEEILFKALAMKREVNNAVSLAYTLNEIATLYKNKGDYQNSLKYGKEAYELIVPEKEIYLGYDVTRHLSTAYYKTGNYKEGYEILQQFQTLSDTILNTEKAAALAEMSSKYELEKKENALTQKDLLIAQQGSRFNRYLLIGLTIIGIILGFFLRSRWRLQKQRLEAKKIQELDQLKSNFFTNITHEFRTPLTVILNSFANKKINGNTITLSIQEANIIQRNTDRLQCLINQLLDLSKLEAGKMKLQVAENDLLLFLKTLTQSFDSLAVQKNIQLQFASQLSSCIVFFDADKVEKIITNLITNAIKFTPDGGEVTVLLLSKENMVDIIVKDTGIGIAPEALPHIFDRFHQTDNSETRNFEGSGIGLALVDQMVKVHQGTIHIESSVNEGSIFTVQLSSKKEDYKSDQISNDPFVRIADKKYPLLQTTVIAPLPEASVEMDDSKSMVMLIEDDPDLRFLLKKQLKEHYHVLEAANGTIGIETALHYIPDLIISDVMMPELSGYEVCETLKKDHRTSHIPIILLTAKATQEEKVEGLQFGADSYLVKPFDKQELGIRIHNLISQRKLLQQRYAQDVIYKTAASPVVTRHDAFIQNLLEIIEKEIANEGFGVEELAQAVHMSRSQLYRKLKALTSKTPNAFLREIRLAKAKELLESDAGNVSEISMMVGFSNANYFYKCFKEAYGKTPGEILKSENIS